MIKGIGLGAEAPSDGNGIWCGSTVPVEEEYLTLLLTLILIGGKMAILLGLTSVLIGLGVVVTATLVLDSRNRGM